MTNNPRDYYNITASGPEIILNILMIQIQISRCVSSSTSSSSMCVPSLALDQQVTNQPSHL